MACCPPITFKAAAHCDSFGLLLSVSPVLFLFVTLQGCWRIYIQLFPFGLYPLWMVGLPGDGVSVFNLEGILPVISWPYFLLGLDKIWTFHYYCVL